eukprot:NODE_6518_length_527_cov_173.662500_g6353_i0.p1 GENE.NODE_6518_length_527_cov_173.662500_g6353_i0~~NODE_6518_length_527_cov_173.662500_g6353_i0.p1  ORF type:complete len:112 (+),score=21.16 NODE_6518_length_527_cov_173.662500_g6353_i0:70-405(+)
MSEPNVTSWASPNDHLVRFSDRAAYIFSLNQLQTSARNWKLCVLQRTRSPWWSPLFQLLTFPELRNASNKLCENYTWGKKGDDFLVYNESQADSFGSDLQAHLANPNKAHH